MKSRFCTQTGGQSSPGYLTSGQQASKGYLQIPQHSSFTSHFQTATPCHRFTLIFIQRSEYLRLQKYNEN